MTDSSQTTPTFNEQRLEVAPGLAVMENDRKTDLERQVKLPRQSCNLVFLR